VCRGETDKWRARGFVCGREMKRNNEREKEEERERKRKRGR